MLLVVWWEIFFVVIIIVLVVILVVIGFVTVFLFIRTPEGHFETFKLGKGGKKNKEDRDRDKETKKSLEITTVY